jgi:cytidine deaminase
MVDFMATLARRLLVKRATSTPASVSIFPAGAFALSAIVAMITAGEYRIETIVAVWQEDKTIDPNGKLYVVSPCGYCRQFMRDLHEDNLETNIILSRDKVVKLKDLLPYYNWSEWS